MHTCIHTYMHAYKDPYLHCIHYMTWPYIALRYITLKVRYIALHAYHYITCTPLHCIHTITSHTYIPLHNITLRYVTLRYITVRYIALHYITLNYITYTTKHYKHYKGLHGSTYIHTLHYVTLRHVTLHYIAYITYIYIDMDWCVNKKVDTETERYIDRYR